MVKITLGGKDYRSQGFEETPWKLSANILQQDEVVGTIGVYYSREMPKADVGPFLKEEKKLIETIANRLNHFLTYKKMSHVFHEWRDADRDLSENQKGDWEAVVDLIRQTDHALFLRVSNKMLNHMCWSGIEEAEELRRTFKHQDMVEGDLLGSGVRGQRLSRMLDFSAEFTEGIYRIAANHLSSDEILSRIQMWIQEDKLAVLLRTVRRRLPLSQVSRSLRRYFFATREKASDRYPLARSLKVFLLECLLSDRVKYIEVAKDNVDIEDLYYLLQKVIFSAESHGKLGGKSAGFFLASQILTKTKEGLGPSSPFRVPKTWYIASDMMLEFMQYNNMDEVIEQKYKDIERVRLEYPHVVDMFRQTVFPPDMANALSMALDDFGDSPLVVRSSSILEDRTELAFVGKYRTVFLGNQGAREDRLRDLMRAVTEVYASNFGPDPIEYRANHGLLEFSEQIGIMIQEVVGTHVGPYFFPAYSGVARSRGDIRWSPEIAGEGGVISVIPGLGTRAADLSGDERPVLVVPGSRSVPTSEDAIRRLPKTVDAINLDTNGMQTLELTELVRKFGAAYPHVELIVSVHDAGVADIRPLDREKPGFDKARVVATFDGLTNSSPFVVQIRNLLRTLEEKLGVPAEVEFASDGEHVYLLQCRPQPIARAPRPAPIPKDVPREKHVFSAGRYVSNGWASNITHIVYSNPEAYEALGDAPDRQLLEQAVAKLNDLLPKRQFVLMLPSSSFNRGDDRPGMHVKYSDIKNAAVVVELFKRESGDDLVSSLGARFLQNFVDSNMLYLPVYLDDERTKLNERFLQRSRSVLAELLPECARVAHVLRVIDVASAAGGNVMHVLMNAELGEAVGLLADPKQEIGRGEEGEAFEDGEPENYWRWRHRMAEQIASQLDPQRFGVAGVYLFGSTKNGTAGPASDIDMLVHFRGTDSQRTALVQWLEGWSLCLDEVNYLRTGYRSGGLLDFHFVTDEDLRKKTSYAVKIDAITDAARPLAMKKDEAPRVPDEHSRESERGTK